MYVVFVCMAVFAALTSNLATTICTLAVLAMAWEMVFFTKGVFPPSAKRFGILFGLTADSFWLPVDRDEDASDGAVSYG